jgi:hypothetical protein
MQGTVKDFYKALDEMRAIYPFDDEKTRLCTRSVYQNAENHLSIITTDEKTGIDIHMSKTIER